MLNENQQIIADAMSEAELQTNVIELAQRLGYLVHAERPAWSQKGYRTPIQGSAGFPDLVLVHSEAKVIFFVELKSQKGKITGAQGTWREALPSLYRLWRPSDWLDGTIEKILWSYLTITVRGG